VRHVDARVSLVSRVDDDSGVAATKDAVNTSLARALLAHIWQRTPAAVGGLDLAWAMRTSHRRRAIAGHGFAPFLAGLGTRALAPPTLSRDREPCLQMLAAVDMQPFAKTPSAGAWRGQVTEILD
jgi:hypothetical protein